MIYFYLWVVVLLSIVLAVPVVAFVEKSRNKKPAAKATEQPADTAMVAVDEPADAVGEADMADFAEAKPAGEDDFSAFDEFK